MSLNTRMTLALAFLGLWCGSLCGTLAQAGPSNRARELVQRAAKAMGGEEKLRGLKTVRFKGNGHTNLLEQSERPEGPWIVLYEEISEVRDLATNRVRQTVTGRGPAAGPEAELIVNDGIAATAYKIDGKSSPGNATIADVDRIALSPERVLLTALEAADLHAAGDMIMQGRPHHLVAFTWQKAPVRLFLNADTGLPTAVETVLAYPQDRFWGVWGDVTTRTYLSFWSLQPGGIHYPLQWDVERNGQPFKSFIISELSFNAAVPAGYFDLPDGARERFEARGRIRIDDLPLGRRDQPARDLAPQIVQIPGSWNVTLVRQPDGVVVLEAPISSGYSARVIAEAERRFPGVPVKAVVSTSDAWPHIGGVREYVARGIPVYALDLNRPILERLLAAHHGFEPDALARAPRKARLRIVSARTVVGAGANRMELYPIRSETGERMIMVYFPEHRLLYGSDLAQNRPDGSFYMPQYLSELMDAVSREKITVETVFAMHLAPTPWRQIELAVAGASSVSAG